MKKGIKPIALGLTLGVFWGVSVLIMGLLGHFAHYGQTMITQMGILIMTPNSIATSFIGGGLAFLHAFIAGIILGWLYNLFTCCHHCCASQKPACQCECECCKKNHSCKE